MTNHDLVTPINVIEHHIHVSNPAPISKKGAPKSAAEKQALSDWVQEMVECGIVGPSDRGFIHSTGSLRQPIFRLGGRQVCISPNCHGPRVKGLHRVPDSRKGKL